MEDPEEDIRDDPLSILQSSSTRGPRPHTQNFDRAAFYGTSSTRAETQAQQFLHSFQGQLMTKYLYMVNFLFALTALAAIVVGIRLGQAHQQRLIGAVSDGFALGIVGFGLAMLCFALLGCGAARTSNRCLLAVYLAMVFLLMFSLGALMLTQALVVDSHQMEGIVRRTWERNVQDRPSEICDLQHDLQCSGFSANCTDFEAHRLDCAKCENEADMQFPQSCWVLLQKKIHHNFEPLTYVSFGTLGVMAFAFVAALGICQHMRMKDQERILYESIAG
eukprot:GGOE01009135.1.p1 GENE.GGOE01009135.1~~GGOE01009135.1.p1  ORF type:complete len:295 (+),score=73.25 GGOE01009135.1:55-885(+)